MKEAALVFAGFMMGWGAEGTWRWIRQADHRKPKQWFRRTPASEAPGSAGPLPVGPQPGPRPIVGQRPSEGAHRAKQSRARFVQRSYRSKK